MVGKLTPFLRKLCRDRRGNILAIGALGFVVLVAIVGGGVDMSRAYMVQSRLQGACDAASLAGRKAVTDSGFTSDAEDEATSYFNNNFAESTQNASGTNFTISADSTGNTITGAASTNVSTTVMRVFGFTTIPISADCIASMGVGNSDVTMVLDTTGSMNDQIGTSGPSKISLLRTAMLSFYQTVKTSTAGSNARIRYAFVPYSSAVNVGRLLYDENPSYLVDKWTVQSRKPITRQVTVQVLDHYAAPVITFPDPTNTNPVVTTGDYTSTQYTTSNNCTSALPADTAWTNTGNATTDSETVINSDKQQVTTTTTTQPKTMTTYSCVKRTSGSGKNKVTYYSRTMTTSTSDFSSDKVETQDPVYRTESQTVFDHYSYEPVEYDTSAFKTFTPVSTVTGTNGATVSSTWDGCIEERKSTPAASFSYSSTFGITPSAATDLNIDSAPNGNATSKWAPMWRQVAYYRTNSSGSLSTATPSLYGGPLYSTGSNNYSFCPYRAQLLQAMDQTAFTNYTNNLKAEGSTYHDLGLLWGARLSSPDGIFATNVNEATTNGAEVSRHMVFMTDGQLATSSIVQSTYGVELYDKRVTTDGSTGLNSRHNSRFLALCEAVKAKGIRVWVIGFDTDLSTELETCASDNSSFTANDATELNEAFQEIAKQVGELRITQ